MESHTVELSQIEVDVLYYLMNNCSGHPSSTLRCVTDTVCSKLEVIESAQDDLMDDELQELNICFNNTGLGAAVGNPSVVPAAWQ